MSNYPPGVRTSDLPGWHPDDDAVDRYYEAMDTAALNGRLVEAIYEAIEGAANGGFGLVQLEDAAQLRAAITAMVSALHGTVPVDLAADLGVDGVDTLDHWLNPPTEDPDAYDLREREQ